MPCPDDLYVLFLREKINCLQCKKNCVAHYWGTYKRVRARARRKGQTSKRLVSGLKNFLLAQ